MKEIKRNILLTPGPATTSDTVKYAQVVPDICPREKEFGDLLLSVASDLTRFVSDGDECAAVLLGGSGTAAVECVLNSVVSDQDRVLIINNGAYGERMLHIAEVYGIPYLEFASSSTGPLDLRKLEEAIDFANEPVTHLAVVHHETTTGLLNDIKSIGRLCKARGLQMIVDAVSSFGALPIDMREMHISYLASSANKNLQGLPGVSFVIAARDRLEDIKHRPRRSFYLDLYAHYEFLVLHRQTRFTPPVQAIYALKQAIVETKAEGVAARYERYKRSWQTLIEGLDALGLKTVVPRECQANLITTVVEPDHPSYSFEDLHDYLYERGVTIYPGKLAEINSFRIGNIGNIDAEDIKRFLALLQDFLASRGIA